MNRSLLFRLMPFAAVFSLFLALNSSNLQAQPPALIAPADGNLCVVTEALLDWDPSPGALSYSCQISDLPDFSNLLFEETGLSETEMVFILSPGTQYYWRAASVYPGPQTDWSAGRSFTTVNAPPTFSYPASNGVCIPLAVTFVWSIVPTAVTYDLQVSANVDFTTLIIDETEISDITYTGSVPDYNTNYYSRVRAVFADCPSVWSAANAFSTTLAPAVLTTPSDGDTGMPLNPSLEWSATSGAATYDLQVDDDQDFTSPLISETGLSATTYAASLTDNNTVYYWRVRSVSTSCTSDWPSEWGFLTEYGPVTLAYPADLAECVPLEATVSWDSIPGTLGYMVEIATDTNFTEIIVSDSTEASTSYTATLPSPVTTYYWRVKAEDLNNSGQWSEVRSFVSAISAPELTSPVNETVGLPLGITLAWENIASGAVYMLQIATDIDFDTLVVDQASLTENSFTVDMPANNTLYYWRVTATSTGCSSLWSEVWQFRTVLAPPELLLPANNAVNQPLSPTLVWEEVPDAETFDFELAYDSEFENHVPGKGKTGIPVNIISPKSLNITTQYYWRVRAKNSDGISLWSTVFNFTTGKLGPAVPVLLSPADDEELIPIALTFTWEAADRADHYNIQVADNYEFESLVISQTGIATNSYDASGLANYTEYWWRVASVNDSGTSAWSEVWMFRTIAIPPTDQVVLTSPANDDEGTTLSLTFHWEDVDRAEAYEFQLSTDNGFENLVADENNLWKPEIYISNLAEDTQYFWRARARNEAGNSPWSEIWNFKTGSPSSVPFGPNSTAASVYPNPFAESAYLNFKLAEGANVIIKLLDVLGSPIKTIANRFMEPGEKNIPINSISLSSGVYLISIEAGDHTEIQRIVVRK